MTRDMVPIGVMLGADGLLSDVCAVHRAVHPYRYHIVYHIVMTSQKVKAPQSAARQSKKDSLADLSMPNAACSPPRKTRRLCGG